MSNCIFNQSELAQKELLELQQSGKLSRKACSALIRAGSVIRALDHQLRQEKARTALAVKALTVETD